MSDEITIRPFRPGDETALLAGYGRVFGPRSLAHWRWKFADNPTGQLHTMVAEHPADGIVGAYVTIPVHYTIEGQRRLVGQGVDMWVLPEHRRYGKRPGLFVNIGLAHYERWGGRGADQTAIHYGWPMANWRIGQKYLRYEMLRDWDFLFREVPPHGFPARATAANLEVQRVPRFAADVDALWARLAPTTQFAAIRDARYLNWRYADAPDATYELFECRERTALRGLAVLTRRDFVLPNCCFLVDWLVPADDADTTTALVAAAEQGAAASRSSVLATLFQPRDPRFLAFQRLGFLVYGTTYFHVVIPFDVHDIGFYREHWYHTLGDSDLL